MRVRNKPGRPPVYSEAERSRRILAAAEQVFTTVGYGAATMEEVARIAGMSKKTVYAHYADKKQLFAEVVSDAEAFQGWKDNRGSRAGDEPLGDLRARVVALIEFALSPRQVRMTRLLIAEAENFPELADEFHERVMRRGHAHLVEGLKLLAEKTESLLKNRDLDQLARMVFGAAMGVMHIYALFGKVNDLSHEKLAREVDAALAAVLPDLARTTHMD